jgi:hypothetical protein
MRDTARDQVDLDVLLRDWSLNTQGDLREIERARGPGSPMDRAASVQPTPDRALRRRPLTNPGRGHHPSCQPDRLVTAIILWNTRYLERAVATLRQSEDVPDELQAHLSPLGWEHVNLTGDYVWGGQPSMSFKPVPPTQTGAPNVIVQMDDVRKRRFRYQLLTVNDESIQNPGCGEMSARF